MRGNAGALPCLPRKIADTTPLTQAPVNDKTFALLNDGSIKVVYGTQIQSTNFTTTIDEWNQSFLHLPAPKVWGAVIGCFQIENGCRKPTLPLQAVSGLIFLDI